MGVAGRIAGLLAIAALQYYWYLQNVPGPLKILSAVYTAFCLAAPRYGLLLLSVMLPIATRIAVQWGGTNPPGLLLEQFVLAACAGSLTRSGPGIRTRLGVPAALMAAVALASAAALAPVSAAATAPPGLNHQPDAFWAEFWRVRDASNTLVWSPVLMALMVAESCLLGWIVEREVRRAPGLGRKMSWALLAGYAAAALLSVQLLIQITYLRFGGRLEGLSTTLIDTRVATEMDVHAAGSIFVLAAIAGAGLIQGGAWQRIIASVLAAMVTLGLWLTGSRFALAALALAALVPLMRWAISFSPRRILIGTVVAVAILTSAWFGLVPKTSRYSELSVSTQTRLMIGEASLQLFARAPVFGIGIDQLYAASESVVDPGFHEMSGYRRQNAHNNFLQVMTELGLVGLGAMLVWLGLLLGRAWPVIFGSDRWRAALSLGLFASVATWLAGHPLLVREFSFGFWVYAAIFAASLPALSESWSRGAAALMGLLVLSVPVRAIVLRQQADLEHLGYGLSLWQTDGERRYREAAQEFHLYLPSGSTIGLPLRLSAAGPEHTEAVIRLDDEVLTTVTLEKDAWQVVDVRLPPSRTRFQLVTVTTSAPPAPAGSAIVHVGRTEVR